LNEQVKLKVNSMFESISGEAGGFPQGTWCTFLRLQGCNLRCRWCDTAHSQDAKLPVTEMTPDEIFEHCHNKHILITGGEPLLQGRALVPLISRLLHSGKKVQIETNGSYPIPHPDWSAIPGYDQLPVYWVVDHKCPSSGMSDQMPTIPHLVSQIHRARKYGDEVWIKWVIADERDLAFALERIGEMADEVTVPHLISPIDGKGEMVRNLIKSIREFDESLVEKIVFSVQLHKIINMP
jgi:7-carboxy-7-deazaguanine synthase